MRSSAASTAHCTCLGTLASGTGMRLVVPIRVRVDPSEYWTIATCGTGRSAGRGTFDERVEEHDGGNGDRRDEGQQPGEVQADAPPDAVRAGHRREPRALASAPHLPPLR